MAASSFNERELSIPADVARIREVRDFADAAAEAFGFGAEDRYRIKLAATEAVANAVEHGASSAGDTIRLRAVDEDGALTFYVTDPGKFVPRVVPRGALPERGRGLAFIGQLMDEVDLSPGDEGTVIRFSKRRVGE